MKPFLLNPARMSFRMADVLGGILLCGKKGEGRFFGNGDCILLDGATGLIAVADGTERTPEASRRFLSLMADQMQEGWVCTILSRRRKGFSSNSDTKIEPRSYASCPPMTDRCCT